VNIYNFIQFVVHTQGIPQTKKEPKWLYYAKKVVCPGRTLPYARH